MEIPKALSTSVGDPFEGAGIYLLSLSISSIGQSL